ncbi:cystathionine gamma-lyase [Candidatus Kryptonium thompsonii]|uniref:Cystathionine gamma-lyase n=1 Tax=Candidatus Kryptonium thompsonii TaxID=1633631 RepID=A0A0N7MSS8_9BACT|nr:PLP-dependent aspartate aminotransferase family protein [Candidatus Kryptonium thompsoni]CUS80064.1 cystathionine gamma-lyase [Candidatus Kryptonium thompsoni]CUS80737.1 cystathionine gamma-lyase [Candidatus Kryptonium thompsoni]CUS82233.1 cystathionine gamma-lyase [Candidatus Kryptonium thompsoni]CUS84401.1 cystathionine gamma-lyase [Candidatus Kryptonium thompsoni]CUS85247.1 cystathionine gamma-lyase [Candidatus Kryptonium thompsoni]
MKFETKAIHIGEEPNLEEGGTGDVVIPIHLSSTFARKEVEKPTRGYEYSRTGNPTRDALEKRLAALEDAQFGLAFSSGMAAETVLALTLLNSGDHVVAFDDLYAGTRRLFDILNRNFKVEFTYVDARYLENVETAIKPNTKLIWLETPTNPLMKLCDIRAISEIAKEKGILVVVDNTFATPYFQKPLKLGADIVVHSTTKFINGHSDSVGGAIMLSNEEIYAKLKFNQNAIGAILSPFDSYLVLRGIKTLAIRMEKHNDNAMKIATYLESHSRVKKVNYPGLKSHPQYELARKQMSGFSGVLSFEIDGGIREVKRFLENLKIFSIAESLGGVESLIEHPATMTHAYLSKDEREKIGITDSLIRVSVGLENVDDLIEDLDNAFKHAF